ncbi:MAG: hypothetical protein ABGZ17_24355, partial [Planctomycetaceae bacterium]
MAAAQSSASNLQRGLSSLGEGIGDALKQYGKNKEERETYEGLIAGEAQRATENKPFYDQVKGGDGDANVSAEQAEGEAPNFLESISGGKKLYSKFLDGDASRADMKAIYANLAMYNAQGSQMVQRLQIEKLVQDKRDRYSYNYAMSNKPPQTEPELEERHLTENVLPIDSPEDAREMGLMFGRDPREWAAKNDIPIVSRHSNEQGEWLAEGISPEHFVPFMGSMGKGIAEAPAEAIKRFGAGV